MMLREKLRKKIFLFESNENFSFTWKFFLGARRNSFLKERKIVRRESNWEENFIFGKICGFVLKILLGEPVGDESLCMWGDCAVWGQTREELRDIFKLIDFPKFYWISVFKKNLYKIKILEFPHVPKVKFCNQLWAPQKPKNISIHLIFRALLTIFEQF